MSNSRTGRNKSRPNDRNRIGIDHDAQEQLRAHADLTAFQRDILQVLSNEDGQEAYGLAIKSRLEGLYGGNVNHGRLYPNLDTLVEEDLIAKSELDKRTNNYALTDEAAELLAERRAWEQGDA